MLTDLKFIDGRGFDNTVGNFKIYVDGYTWYLDTAKQIQDRVDMFRSSIQGKNIKIWNNLNGKLLRDEIVSKGK